MALGAIEYTDFSGGITDFYIDCPQNQYKKADNLLITQDKQLESREGSVFFLSAPQVPIAARIGHLINVADLYLFAQSSRKLYEVNTSWNLISMANDALASAHTTSNFLATSQWNFQIFGTSDDLTSKPFKVFKDATNTTRIRTAGLPPIAEPTFTPSSPGGANSYLYAFHLIYTYKVGNALIEYVDLGPTTYVSMTTGAVINPLNPNTINLPTLTNGGSSTNDNYDIANIKIRIHRTLSGGQTPFFVADVAVGTATYVDQTIDGDLEDRDNVYDVSEKSNDPPPLSKFVHVVDSLAVWANVLEEDGVHRPYRARLSKPGDPDSVPKQFIVDVDDEIVGVSSFKSKPILFCNQLIYRIDGTYDEAGRGEVIAQKINEVVGCVGHNSVVQTEFGVFWIAPDGAYFTDGYQVMSLSKHLPNSFKSWLVTANYKKIYGGYDAYAKRVWWAYGPQTNENSAALVCDLRFGIKEEMPFSTTSGASFAPAALVFFQKQLIRAHASGYLFKHDPLTFTDPKVENSSPSTWTVETVLFDFISGATSAGSRTLRKLWPRLVVQAENQSNLSLAINGINDDGRSTLPCNAVVFRNNIIWGDDDVIWGDETLIWKYDGIIEAIRRFSSGGLRASYKQVQFTNDYVVTANSKVFGSVTVNGPANTAVLNNPTYEWPLYSVDYYISFSYDNYEKEYKVLVRTPTTLTLEDTLNTIPTGSYDFYLKGYRKNEKLRLISYSLVYNTFSVSQSPSNGTYGVSNE